MRSKFLFKKVFVFESTKLSLNWKKVQLMYRICKTNLSRSYFRNTYKIFVEQKFWFSEQSNEIISLGCIFFLNSDYISKIKKNACNSAILIENENRHFCATPLCTSLKACSMALVSYFKLRNIMIWIT